MISLGYQLPNPLSKDEEKKLLENWNNETYKVLAERNMRLAVFLAKKRKPANIDDEEAFSAAQFGLLKAARSFDPKAGVRFATYAATCITNEILMSARRERKHERVTSFCTVISVGSEGEALLLEDILQAPGELFDDVCGDMLKEAFLNNNNKSFSDKERLILKMLLDGKKREEIGAVIGHSQAHISRLIGRMKEKIAQELCMELQ